MIMIFDPCDLEWHLAESKVIGHSAGLVMDHCDQVSSKLVHALWSYIRFFGCQKKKNSTETEYRCIACGCINTKKRALKENIILYLLLTDINVKDLYILRFSFLFFFPEDGGSTSTRKWNRKSIFKSGWISEFYKMPSCDKKCLCACWWVSKESYHVLAFSTDNWSQFKCMWKSK